MAELEWAADEEHVTSTLCQLDLMTWDILSDFHNLKGIDKINIKNYLRSKLFVSIQMFGDSLFNFVCGLNVVCCTHMYFNLCDAKKLLFVRRSLMYDNLPAVVSITVDIA